MRARPNVADIIKTISSTLNEELAPELTSTRAKMRLAMVQVMLQYLIQHHQHEQPLLIAEYNEMLALHRALAEQMQELTGEAADRIRQRSESLAARPALPSPFPSAQIVAMHLEVGEGLLRSLDDLDQLLRAGNDRAQTGLDMVRRHIAASAARDYQSLFVLGGGFSDRQ